MSMSRPRGCARDAGDSSTGAVSLGLGLPAPTATTTTAAATTATDSASSASPIKNRGPPTSVHRWACLHDGRKGRKGGQRERERERGRGRKMLVSPSGTFFC